MALRAHHDDRRWPTIVGGHSNADLAWVRIGQLENQSRVSTDRTRSRQPTTAHHSVVESGGRGASQGRVQHGVEGPDAGRWVENLVGCGAKAALDEGVVAAGGVILA